ncbi:MAG TPA: SLBB domain-containing protein [Gemmatimonadales bacterium]|nr:SLBB domain-containing protein [Gemmatimonadales bacterium]
MLLRHILTWDRVRSLGLAALVLVFGSPLSGQVPNIPGLPPGARPTTEQARQILETQPELVRQLRDRLQGSGLTPDQIRMRLRAEGYPEDLLDPYLAGFDTTETIRPSPATLGAVQALGLLSAESVDSLADLDSARVLSDSLRRVLDSLNLVRLDSLRQDSLADTLTMRGGRLKRFGLEVFRRQTTRFQGLTAGPVDENYRLGPGDILVLILTGDVERTYPLEVNREGFLVIPQVGQVHVANLTMAELESVLYSRLGRVYSGVRRGPNARTRFTVTVARLRNLQVFVAGDVVRPGAFQMPASGTVLTALYAAGGPTESGTLRSVVIRRGNTVVDTVDLYDYLLRGINRSDVRLQAGDVVFVPVRGPLVSTIGRVVRPAVYEIRPSETLRDLVAMAGGFEAGAVQGRIQVHRVFRSRSGELGSEERVVLEVAPEAGSDSLPSFPLAAGDSVIVFAVPAAVRGFVTVRGNVWREGRVGISGGMKLSDAVRLAGGPKPDVYLPQILVSRLTSDSSRIQLRSAFADTTGQVTNDLPLQGGDVIEIFSRSAFRERPWVTIVGAVRRGGRIPYREGMRIRDAVLLANGTTEDAAPEGTEVARLPEDRTSGVLAQTIPAPLPPGFLTGGSPDSGSAVDAGGADMVLRPYDNVLIPRRGGWDLQRLVAVGGQVRAPGRYALSTKTERLSEVLGRAGGLTNEAYPGGIEFYRRSGAGPGGAAANGQEIGIRPLPAGYRARLGLDLPRVLKDPGYRDNIILVAGDSIHIPEFNPVVTVLGAVNSPGPVAFSPNKSLDWYVRAAGGYTGNADKKRPYVTQPDGRKQGVTRRFLLADDLPQPRPGAQIFVPARTGQDQPGNAAAILGVVASVVASITTIVIVATQ